jgi:hypothetical protein
MFTYCSYKFCYQLSTQQLLHCIGSILNISAFWDVTFCSRLEYIDVLEGPAAFIIIADTHVVEAKGSSETSVHFDDPLSSECLPCVCCKNHTKHVKSTVWQNEEFLNITASVACSSTVNDPACFLHYFYGHGRCVMQEI